MVRHADVSLDRAYQTAMRATFLGKDKCQHCQHSHFIAIGEDTVLQVSSGVDR